MFSRLLKDDPCCLYLSTLSDCRKKDAIPSATVIHHRCSQRCDDAGVSMIYAIFAKYQCRHISSRALLHILSISCIIEGCPLVLP